MTTRWMLFDDQRCFGCNACVVACQQEYGLPAQIRFNNVDVTVNMAAPTNAEKITFKPMLCNQCNADPIDSPCMSACPVRAIERRSDGVIFTDRVKCVGCRLCTVYPSGCPFRARSIDGAGKAVKCNFCFDRMVEGETAPYCVKTCPSGARQMTFDANPPVGVVRTDVANMVTSSKVFDGNIPNRRT